MMLRACSSGKKEVHLILRISHCRDTVPQCDCSVSIVENLLGQ